MEAGDLVPHLHVHCVQGVVSLSIKTLIATEGHLGLCSREHQGDKWNWEVTGSHTGHRNKESSVSLMPRACNLPWEKAETYLPVKGVQSALSREVLCCAITVCNYISKKYLRSTEKTKERKKIEKWVGLASWVESTGHASTSSQGCWDIWGGESITPLYFHVLTASKSGGSMRLHAWVFWLCPKGLKVGYSPTSKAKKISQNETFI